MTSCIGVVDENSLVFVVWWGVDTVDVVVVVVGGEGNEDDDNCCVGTTDPDCIPGGGIGC